MRQKMLLTLAGAGALAAAVACGHRAPAPGPARAASDSVEVGYGAQQKDKTTGAVTTLSEKDIAVRPLQIEQLLRGKVPGLQIIRNGAAISFRLRSTSSMTVTQDALVVVDGVPIQTGNEANALAGLTADDIKQVNVLKDVASTSIYGLRGAGGVIVITTKKQQEESR
jgi:TonB-dependent starch-binding outer membrane protein SusC